MGETIQMTRKAQKRVKLMEMVIAGHITLKAASQRMGVSYRQAIRIKQTYLTKGDVGLNHGLIGQQGNHRTDPIQVAMVLELYQERYYDFGPKLASEMLLKEYGIQVNAETLRKWLIKEGLWKNRKKSSHKKRRKRRSCFGMMLQMDGSIHDWFENGKHVCLLNCVDDATGKTFGLFDTGETTEIALRALYCWIKKYGVPQSIYTDYKTVYFTKREPTLEEQLAGNIPMTSFGKVCHKLGIELIYASSPQAKGRVERSNGILQDRLVKMMRLKEIKDIKSANEYLMNEFWEEYNDKFEKPPAEDEDAHVPLLETQILDEYINFEDERTISNDYVIRWKNRFFQITEKQNAQIYPRLKIRIQKWLDQSIHIWYKQFELSFVEILDSKHDSMDNIA